MLGEFFVSIPHRQARNKSSSLLILLRREGFQFLIGRLATVQALLLKAQVEKFQFLIGRLATIFFSFSHPLFDIRFNSSQVGSQQRKGVISEKEYQEFQFLIGRLATTQDQLGRSLRMQFQFLIGRLATSKKAGFFISIFVCFNSSQVGSQLKPPIPKLLQNQVSIPHRQARNAISLYCCFAEIAVSIPHRQARNPFLYNKIKHTDLSKSR